MEDLAPSSQLLYTYDPDLARQMLDDAGFPATFKMTAVGTTTDSDIAEMLMDQWSLLGIELELEIVDSATASNLGYMRSPLEADMMLRGTVIHTPVFFAYRYFHSGGNRNIGYYRNSIVETNLLAASMEEDPETLRLMMEEAFREIVDDAPNIPFANTPQYHYWWPWLKNCFGEAWYYHRNADVHNWWLDQELKESMGY